MKRFRIDFTVRELDCPPEEARGVSLGEDVSVDKIHEFFTRCRDAVVTLFVPKRQVARPNEFTPQEIEEERKKRQLEELWDAMKYGGVPGPAASNPRKAIEEEQKKYRWMRDAIDNGNPIDTGPNYDELIKFAQGRSAGNK
jgi:hypothetical protein